MIFTGLQRKKLAQLLPVKLEILVPQCEPQVFSNVSPEQYATLVQKASGAGIDMSGNSGTASKFGVEVSWSYLPDKQELTLQCLNTPFFMSAEDINERLHALVKSSIG